LNEGHGIFLWYSDHNIIKNNICNLNNVGIALHESNHNIILNNTCDSNGYQYWGIQINICNDVIISNNTCIRNGDGIYVQYSFNITIINNTFNLNNGNGIYSFAKSSIIENNTCDSNYGRGIYSGGDSNLFVNNTCYLNGGDGIMIVGILNIIRDNICNSNNKSGISIGGELNIIRKNKCSFNKADGIDLDGNSNLVGNNIYNSNNDDGIDLIGNSNSVENNSCNSNKQNGIFIYGSYNIISNNTCNFNYHNGTLVFLSNSNTIVENTYYQNYKGGISLSEAKNSILKDNVMEFCGILIQGGFLDQWNTHTIDITNTVNGRPVYYWKDQMSGTIPLGAGEVILANCNNIQITNQNLTDSTTGILLGFTINSKISFTLCTNNLLNGIYIFSSTSNIIDNCTFFSNVKSDFYLEENSKNNIAINSTSNTVHNEGYTSELIIKNYLHIQVNHTENFPVEGGDVLVKENDKVIHATPGYGGVTTKTDVYGQVKWLLVTDRTYLGGIAPVKNIISVNVKYDNNEAINNNREIDMATSHFEYFYVNYTINSLPDKIILESPYNNSYINLTSQLLIKWKIGIDENGDTLTYYLQINDIDNDWESLILDRNMGNNELRNAYNFLRDGIYQWRVRAHDGVGFGPWSDIWNFTVDTIPPDILISINNDEIYTNTVDVNLQLFAHDSGSGAAQMTFSNDKVSWRGWESYNLIKFYELSKGDGEKIIYFKVRDRANNTAITHDTIILDTSPPNSLSISINNGSSKTNSTSVILNLFAQDNLSGVNLMAFSNDGKNWSKWENYSELKLYTIPSGDEVKIIYFKVIDNAGNIADPISTTILLNSTSPQIDKSPDEDENSPNIFNKYANYWFFLILIIIIISILILIQLIRKQKKQPKPEGELPTVETITVKPTTPTISEITNEQSIIHQTLIQQPVISSDDFVSAPTTTTSTAKDVSTSTSTITSKATPIPEAQAQTPTLPPTQITSEFQLQKATLTKNQQLNLLRERFLIGEVTEETYNKLRGEIETIGVDDITKEESEVGTSIDEEQQSEPGEDMAGTEESTDKITKDKDDE
jgi:parallel beta-helix repeat protein